GVEAGDGRGGSQTRPYRTFTRTTPRMCKTLLAFCTGGFATRNLHKLTRLPASKQNRGADNRAPVDLAGVGQRGALLDLFQPPGELYIAAQHVADRHNADDLLPA